MGIDFNPTFFAHPKAADGFTLAHPRRGHPPVLDRSRHRLPPDRRGDRPALGHALRDQRLDSRRLEGHARRSRKAPRERLARSLDAIFAEPIDPKLNRDAVEGKLFGLGSESYVVGSHEFYLGYAITRKKLLCLDAGHFHPTEVISDKISAVLMWLDEILLHVSRGVRWDSDHVVTLTDELQAIARRSSAATTSTASTSGSTSSTPASTGSRPG